MDDVGSLSYWFLETCEGVVLHYLHSSVGGKMSSVVLSSCLCHFLGSAKRFNFSNLQVLQLLNRADSINLRRLLKKLKEKKQQTAQPGVPHM